MPKNIFVYGTLLVPEIVEALTGKSFESKKAVLKNYKKYCVYKNEIAQAYPAITKEEGSKVLGQILFDVDEASEKVLDFFEQDYSKETVAAEFEKGTIPVLVYVWKSQNSCSLKGEWSLEEFKEKYLDLYINEVIPKDLKLFQMSEIPASL